MDCRFGRMVTAPSAISSWFRIGEILDPQLSEPTQIKWPVWLAFLAAWRSRLWTRETYHCLLLCSSHESVSVMFKCDLTWQFKWHVGLCRSKIVWIHKNKVTQRQISKAIYSHQAAIFLPGSSRMTSSPYLSRFTAKRRKCGKINISPLSFSCCMNKA